MARKTPDFRATLDLMAALRYDSAFSFKYSLRENTRAFKLGDTVSEEEKGRRLAEVIALQERMSLERNRALVGERFAVLVEGPARRGGGMLAGKTPQFKTAVFAAADCDKAGRYGDGARGVRDRDIRCTARWFSVFLTLETSELP